MVLWSIQHINVWAEFQKNGVLQANSNYIDHYFVRPYIWLSSKMNEVIGPPPNKIEFPLWAWNQYQGNSKKKPDLRSSGYLPKGTKGVRIKFDIDESSVLLSDFELWHYVLNYWYLPVTEKDGNKFEKTLNKAGYSFYLNKPVPNVKYHQLIEESWNKIFNLDWVEKDISSLNQDKSIQATFWELKLENVIDITKFIAR